MAPTLFITSVLAAVESRLQNGDEPAETTNELQAAEGSDSTDESDVKEPRSSLFQCPDCDLVFVAADEHTCSNCETDADQVPSTLSEAP